jgi:hypothetical protein
MPHGERSPRITSVAWGHVEVEGAATPYKDAKLFPGGSKPWNWTDTGTSHAPGIQPGDVRELLEQGATVVVLARGMYERLQVCPETIQLLRERKVEVHVLPTEEAVERYNRLAETTPVGALIHSTC